MVEEAYKINESSLADKIESGNIVEVSIDEGPIKEMVYFGFKNTKYGITHSFIIEKNDKTISEWSCYERNIIFSNGIIRFETVNVLLDTHDLKIPNTESRERYNDLKKILALSRQ